ncbi:MAG: L-dopachrome tautomerase-related protein [Bacteroidota bacterium]
MRKKIMLAVGLLLGAWGLSNCKKDDTDIKTIPEKVTLTEVASSWQQWTGVAITSDNRLFVNYPRWTDTVKISVAEIKGANQVEAFPDMEWNSWTPAKSPGDHFICVQAVFVDKENFLWVLDAGSPKQAGVVAGGAKLLKFDPTSRQLIQKIIFKEPVILPKSYINDVNVDTSLDFAYLTDSNAGAIVVVNLTTGESRRVLDKHFSTKSENKVLKINGEEVRDPKDQSRFNAHSDGIALSFDGSYLYYHAVTGNTLYRIATNALRDAALTPDQLGEKVENLGNTGVTDGMLYGPDNGVYQTALELNAITVYKEGKTQIVVKDDRLQWPDGFALGSDNTIYVTTSQIHIKSPKEPYKLFKFKVDKLD